MTDWSQYLADRKAHRTRYKDRQARKAKRGRAKAKAAIPFIVTDSASYGQYLRSHHWRRLRKATLAQHAGRCFCCGRQAKRPHLHHIHYENLWHEKPEDLAVFCGQCHEGWHFGVSLGSNEQSHLEACAMGF